MDLSALERWFTERPQWLQEAARRLVAKESLVEQDYVDLLLICTAEAANEPISAQRLASGALAGQDTSVPLRIQSIADVHGVNALRPRRPLDFGTAPIAIVYGRNGAGKSGYVRLLKNACCGKTPESLLGDVYDQVSPPKTAAITFQKNEAVKTAQWTGQPVPELGGVEIYDTKCGLVYVDEENEVAWEPWLLRLFSRLTDACTNLSTRIRARIASLVSSKPVLPSDYATTDPGKWYHAISAQTTTEDVERETAWPDELEAELGQNRARLAEINPAARAAALRRQAALVKELADEIVGWRDALDDKKCCALLEAKADAASKRTAADCHAQRVFENSPLDGIGSETWKLMWDAARKYSETVAYPGVTFPNLGERARCLLCQRELDQPSRDRFAAFNEFVMGQLHNSAREAECLLQQHRAALPHMPDAQSLSRRLELAELDGLQSSIAAFTQGLAARIEGIAKAESLKELPPVPSSEFLPLLRETYAATVKRAESFESDAEGQNRPALEARVRDLSALEWLNQQRGSIAVEVERLRAIVRLQAADDLTSTFALSRRKSSLAEELVTGAFVKRFEEELRKLGAAHLAVELVKTRTAVGKVYHRVRLKGANPRLRATEVLSEGEFRIVSLAMFLADTVGRAARTTFVFDDPISSLDHVYEEATAQRLVELGQSRQLIVFTHRLSLAAFIEKYAEKSGTKSTLISLSEYTPGDVTELPINLQSTSKAANGLLNERLTAAKKALAKGDEHYVRDATHLCHDIRVLLERVVEMNVLNAIIRRFSPEVNTKGRIHAIATVTSEDCDFVDQYMTKYSRYEHSQPEESPGSLPRPDEIEADLNAIKEFIEKRTRAARGS